MTPENPLSLAPFTIIRTETVLSRLPIHSLAKTGHVDIRIVKRNSKGEVTLNWEVSPSARYGPPRQLAYKLDSLVINRRVDESGRPIPPLLRLGSLRDIAKQLDLGGDTNTIRRALRQNAFTAITAKLVYRSSDGQERRIEADFTRYGVIFAGERLPTGQQADAVYLVFNEPYLQVLNNAPRRPLNYDYLKELNPAAQRFYEIVSYKMFSALKGGRPQARLAYSEFCTFSAQARYQDYDHFKKQMYKIHRPHLASGYLASVAYEASLDGDSVRDWIMLYEPGPRARAEFETFEHRRIQPPASLAASPALAELRRRGVPEKQAQRLLTALRPEQPVAAQLAWGDQLIRQSGRRIHNPIGFYIYLVRENVLPPVEFRSPEPMPAPEEGLDAAYLEYAEREIERLLAADASAEDYPARVEAKKQEILKQYKSAALWPAANLLEVAEGALRAEIVRSLQLLTRDEFRRRNAAGT